MATFFELADIEYLGYMNLAPLGLGVVGRIYHIKYLNFIMDL